MQLCAAAASGAGLGFEMGEEIGCLGRTLSIMWRQWSERPFRCHVARHVRCLQWAELPHVGPWRFAQHSLWCASWRSAMSHDGSLSPDHALRTTRNDESRLRLGRLSRGG